jgi:hypothetical protein
MRYVKGPACKPGTGSLKMRPVRFGKAVPTA